MSQSNSQQIQPAAPQSARVSSAPFNASIAGLRTVAMALLVDRALSA